MISDIAFWASVIVAFGAALLIFKAREMAHAMVGFLMVTVAGAALLALLGLPLLALLQLFIMVGGVSTYLFVGVSSENLSKFRHTSLPVLVVLAIMLCSVPIYKISSMPGLGVQSNTLDSGSLTAALGGDLALFYMLAVLLFGVGIASIMMMRSFGRGGRR